MADVTAADYCRHLEAYLCRKNEGHLVRVVGPAFDLVCGWAARGIPLPVAERGIDRTVERARARGPRRRPLRIEFCDADVLEAFDEWRRAVGVSEAGTAEATPASSSGQGHQTGRTATLPGHLARAIARLTTARAGADATLSEALGDVVRELDRMHHDAGRLRGEARDALIDRLRELDEQIVQALRTSSGAAALEHLERQAEDDLRPFRGRLPQEAYEQARRASVDRLLRAQARVPDLVYE